jgi:hypothetical protein
MSFSIKYIPIYTNNIDTEVQFFIQYSNLSYAGKIQLTPDIEGVLLKLDVNKELYLLIIPSDFLSGDVNPAPDFKIIVNTSDCLKEYLLLKDGGIEFEERPKYLPLGLAAKFKVADGSQYMLLEERDYDQMFT